jgi:hypothetical protein
LHYKTSYLSHHHVAFLMHFLLQFFFFSFSFFKQHCVVAPARHADHERRKLK